MKGLAKLLGIVVIGAAIIITLAGCGNPAGGGGGGSGAPPAHLDKNATYAEAVAKLDEIIAYCEANPGTKTNAVLSSAVDLKTGLAAFKDNWYGTNRSTAIASINSLISTLDNGIGFVGVEADGWSTQVTTRLTLTFTQAIPGLSAEDIILSGVPGVQKGNLEVPRTDGGEYYYVLPISGFTTSGNLTVEVIKAGYAISGSPKTVTIYYVPPTPVEFVEVYTDGSSAQTTTLLAFEFTQAIPGLSAEDITLSGVPGVRKGSLYYYGGNSSEGYYGLPISGFTTGGILTVEVKKAGYAISGSPKTVTIYYYSGGGQ
jgi:hypothetical protein